MGPKHPLLVRPFALVALAAAKEHARRDPPPANRSRTRSCRAVWRQVHGRAQVFEFMVPLVMGFGTHLVPRIVPGHPIRAEHALAWPCPPLRVIPSGHPHADLAKAKVAGSETVDLRRTAMVPLVHAARGMAVRHAR